MLLVSLVTDEGSSTLDETAVRQIVDRALAKRAKECSCCGLYFLFVYHLTIFAFWRFFSSNLGLLIGFQILIGALAVISIWKLS